MAAYRHYKLFHLMDFTTYITLHQLSFSDTETENQRQSTYEQTTPVVLSDAGPDYTLMTGPGSDKVQRRLAGDAHKTLAKVDSDYLEPSTGVVDNPDYQRPVPAVPVKNTPTYAALTERQSSPNTAEGEPDYVVVDE